ncbi:hypothetical protein [Spirosoma montaniterrae]|uniref:Uncharacterized protein n=1 Tax=Spirosoma montaniterrae TaxID=1178516 RepID=A0A1P9WRM6_9BACT|nr:hypothetical protein [Spirosoma montaniterrae]AQG78014.1 hypothetical protein AWR27_00790 [Spirosoma montaniterrae]
MKDELTAAMHEEFNLDPETEKKHIAFAVFRMLNLGMSLPDAMRNFGVTDMEQLRPYVTEFNGIVSKDEQIKLFR